MVSDLVWYSSLNTYLSCPRLGLCELDDISRIITKDFLNVAMDLDYNVRRSILIALTLWTTNKSYFSVACNKQIALNTCELINDHTYISVHTPYINICTKCCTRKFTWWT